MIGPLWLIAGWWHGFCMEYQLLIDKVSIGDNRASMGDNWVSMGDNRVSMGDNRVSIGDTWW